MKYKNLFPVNSLIAGILLFLVSFTPANDNSPKQVKIAILTDYGVIKIKLYNETPLHRDNFIKLIQAHYYDSLLFHRVIQTFMIQGGDPDSKHALPGALLGDGGPKYTIPAEFNPKLFHKKGVIAAAREGDLDNPLQASSGSQFYIVQGKVFTDSLLQWEEKRITKMMVFNSIITKTENKALLDDYKRFVKEEKLDSVKYINDIVNEKVEKELPKVTPYKFSEEQRNAYETVGGAPHLDNSYTVFGEVYDGLDIVDKIAAEPTGKNARPIKDIHIISISIIP